MTYVDTDYILALTKKQDWLKERAEKAVEKKPNTSTAAFIELLLYARKHNVSPQQLVVTAKELVECVRPISVADIFRAAVYLEENPELNVFDALHAAAAGEEEILSSDGIYSKLGLKHKKM